MKNMKRSILYKDIYLYTDVYKNNDSLYNKINTSSIFWDKLIIEESASIDYVKPRVLAGNISFANLMIEDVDNVKLEIFKCQPIFLKLSRDYFLGKLKKLKSYVEINLIKYSINDFFENHTDSIITNEKKYSLFYYLNDNYLGGEIVFTNLNLKIKPKANSVIIFPSGPEYAHEVLPITYGTKYVISAFLK